MYKKSFLALHFVYFIHFTSSCVCVCTSKQNSTSTHHIEICFFVKQWQQHQSVTCVIKLNSFFPAQTAAELEYWVSLFTCFLCTHKKTTAFSHVFDACKMWNYEFRGTKENLWRLLFEKKKICRAKCRLWGFLWGIGGFLRITKRKIEIVGFPCFFLLSFSLFPISSTTSSLLSFCRFPIIASPTISSSPISPINRKSISQSLN